MAQIQDANISPDIIAEAVKRVMAELGRDSVQVPGKENSAGALDSKKDFPLSDRRPDLVKSASGLSLDDITIEKVVAGEVGFEDVKIRPETLEYQAQIAESSGRPNLASNLRRAAEMVNIPDERVLEIYNNLRPYRCTRQELLDIADELVSKYNAKICAAHVREAAAVYEKRNRLKR